MIQYSIIMVFVGQREQREKSIPIYNGNINIKTTRVVMVVIVW